ncbi:MAG: hypothetical protein Q8N39_00470 [Pelolinea sp.]|nr:hypothetical protein [Pelolinea sp.]
MPIIINLSLLMLVACSQLPIETQPDFSKLPTESPPDFNQLPAETANDFSLRFKWNTGTLPPQYTYTYTILLEPGKGSLEYQPGYGDDNSLQWSVDFALSEKQMHDLFDYLNSQDMFRSSWKKGEPMLGGSGTSLILNANGKQYTIPSISILASSEYARVDAAMEAIRALVPQTIWDEMDVRQKEYEANYKE